MTRIISSVLTDNSIDIVQMKFMNAFEEIIGTNSIWMLIDSEHDENTKSRKTNIVILIDCYFKKRFYYFKIYESKTC